MIDKPDGGPAFPRTAADPAWGNGTESFEGMSLRDYFAGQVLIGALYSPLKTPKTVKTEDLPKAIASVCYEMADAMIEACNKSPEPPNEIA